MQEYWQLVTQLQQEYEIKLFIWIWKKRLVNSIDEPCKVIKVRGWRTALVDNYPSPGGRSTVTFLFKIKFFKRTWYI